MTVNQFFYLFFVIYKQSNSVR